jgi:hypothetical protein
MDTPLRSRSRAVLLGLMLALALLAAACGGEEAVDGTDLDVSDIEDTDAAAAQDPQTYCAAAAALDDAEESPTPEQLDVLVRQAPDAIRADAQVVADRYAESGFDAFDQPEVQEAIANLDAWKAENC